MDVSEANGHRAARHSLMMRSFSVTSTLTDMWRRAKTLKMKDFPVTFTLNLLARDLLS